MSEGLGEKSSLGWATRERVMSDRLNVQRDASVGERLQLPCETCAAKTFHVVQASVDIDGTIDRILDYWQHYQVVQCQGCDEYSFRLLERTSDFAVAGSETGELELEDRVTLFPPRIAGRPPLRHLLEIPARVRSIYDETRKALLGRQPILAGVGLRSLIEAVCREKGAPGDNLQKRIDSLFELGVLTHEGADILHALRGLGNASAHETEAHSEADLSTAFDVVEHLLQTVYIIPKKAARLRRGHA
jgi:Domain of unknown function (DUF4145)